ncbi:hypothetical protein DPV78_012080 [Talaromyces pinophilus]|nr:hypothetical protein DPV78_012080 [Talaromyces pinophilus]
MATRYANNDNHTSQPLPSPPLSSSTSPRRNRGISFGGKSEKSHKSSGSHGKISLHETPEEKARRALHTKADPTLAMNEAQPAMVAALEKSNLGSLRAIQHKDQYGNVITDPDLSNPTRPRFERPLDTIRSFEAAIDGSYHSRRMSYVTDASQSRPASYYGGNGNDHNQNYGRPSMSRPDSYVDHGASGSNGYSYQGRGNRPRHGNGRMNGDYTNGNGYNQQQPYYPNSPYQRSNDNFTAGSGSANTDQWGNSTDPSSVNSSFDRLQQQAAQQKQYQQQQQAESYGFNGFGGNPDTSFHQQDYQNGAPPPPPPHGQSNSQANGAMSSQPFNPPLPAPARKVADDDKKKRGSWFKRRFSKD